ncbi:hypothetical protein CLV47_11741 [Antricoccus suffuscus]|uniref:Sap-like sulfolipid-1-addressing protein n=1 Tax=Antricoccus suffuscus TaxID=1629062 RepID=A0A2T0ZVL7_9ACTN|nr:hypothetical protein [Antricoccus suffuscus]PRZ40406.1 hypothetical protein CLV47_11741 [Antricoccus suffuscus]
MLALIASALALALVGFDPAGGLFAAGALALGARSRDVAVFGFAVIAGSMVYGVVLALTIGRRLSGFDWTAVFAETWWRAAVEATLAIVALVWMWWLVRRRGLAPGTGFVPKVGRAGLLTAGAIYASMSLLDPSLAALVVIAGRGHSTVAVVCAMVLWSAVSQVPLILILAAMAFGLHHQGVAWLQARWAQIGPRLRMVATGALGLAGVLLICDTLFWVVGRSFLIPGPTG